MNERIVMFPTLQQATQNWMETIRKYKGIIVESRTTPLSITLTNGDRWIFHSETEGQRAVLGYCGKIYKYEEGFFKAMYDSIACQTCKHAGIMRNSNGYIVGTDCDIQGCDYERREN